MLNRSTTIRWIVPLIALGCLAFGFKACAADSAVEVAVAAPPRVKIPEKEFFEEPQRRREKLKANELYPAAPPRETAKGDSNWGQVSGTAVNVRSGPGLNHAVLTTLKGGEYVKIGATSGNWIEIEWPQNVPVWVARETVQIQPAAKDRMVTAKASTAARGSASRKAPALGQIEPGLKLIVLGESDGWLKVKPPTSIHAYISSKFVMLNVRKPVAADKKSVAENASEESKITDTTPAKNKAALVKSMVTEPAASSVAAVKVVVPFEEELIAQQLSESVRVAEADAARREAEDKMRDEQEEVARQVVDAKQLEAIETARRNTEMKKRAEQEQQALQIAEAKRLEETTGREAEAQNKATLEQEAHRAAEAKRLAEIEAAHTATVTPVIEETSKREEQLGVFVAPSEIKSDASTQYSNIDEPVAVVTYSKLPEPSFTAATRTQPHTIAQLANRSIPIDSGAAIPDSSHSRFVMPNRAPKLPGSRAEVVEFADDAPKLETKSVKATSQAETKQFVQPPATLVFPVSVPQASCLQVSGRQDACGTAEALPKPSGAAPRSFRLPPFQDIRAESADNGAHLTSAEGTLERRTAGAGYALIRGGVTVYNLSARNGVNFDGMVGQKVRLSGVATQGGTEPAILDVACIMSQE